jgi:hypothetical protein
MLGVGNLCYLQVYVGSTLCTIIYKFIIIAEDKNPITQLSTYTPICPVIFYSTIHPYATIPTEHNTLQCHPSFSNLVDILYPHPAMTCIFCHGSCFASSEVTWVSMQHFCKILYCRFNKKTQMPLDRTN